MDHPQHCDALEQEITRFAVHYDQIDPLMAIPSCPKWTAHDLAQHLGTIHRWAEFLVRSRAPKRIPSTEMGLDDGPATGEWLSCGGHGLLTTLRAGNPKEPMWAWGRDQRLGFWSRRQLHETLVHRMDLELASRIEVTTSPTIAADAIDELLTNLWSAAHFSSRVLLLIGQGETLRIRATDIEASWDIKLNPDAFELVSGVSSPQVTISSTALELLLVLYRRRTCNEAELAVEGDDSLFEFWIANSALE